MSGLLVNLKRDLGFHDIQKHNLGIVVPDVNGDLWSYVQLQAAVAAGNVVADHTIVAGGSVTRAQAVGTNRLRDTGQFTAALQPYIPGALGQIHGNAAGEMQAFYVKRVVDTNEIEIALLADDSGWEAPGSGWTAALTTASDYSVVAPGVVAEAAAAGRLRGVAQHAGSAGEFGFVKQTGLGIVIANGGGTAFTAGATIAVAANGVAVGGAAGTLPSAVVGVALFGDVAATGEQIVVAELQIQNNVRSYRLVDAEHAYNRNTIQ